MGRYQNEPTRSTPTNNIIYACHGLYKKEIGICNLTRDEYALLHWQGVPQSAPKYKNDLTMCVPRKHESGRIPPGRRTLSCRTYTLYTD